MSRQWLAYARQAIQEGASSPTLKTNRTSVPSEVRGPALGRPLPACQAQWAGSLAEAVEIPIAAARERHVTVALRTKAMCHHCLVQRGAAAPDRSQAGSALHRRCTSGAALGPARARERHGVDAARGAPAARHRVKRLSERLVAGQGLLPVRGGPGASAAPAGPRRTTRRRRPTRGRRWQRRRQ